MIIGQTYQIKYIYYEKNASTGSFKSVFAKLIFKGKYFYTFEFQTKSGDLIRTTINKHDLRRRPGLIKEA